MPSRACSAKRRQRRTWHHLRELVAGFGDNAAHVKVAVKAAKVLVGQPRGEGDLLGAGWRRRGGGLRGRRGGISNRRRRRRRLPAGELHGAGSGAWKGVGPQGQLARSQRCPEELSVLPGAGRGAKGDACAHIQGGGCAGLGCGIRDEDDGDDCGRGGGRETRGDVCVLGAMPGGQGAMGMGPGGMGAGVGGGGERGRRGRSPGGFRRRQRVGCRRKRSGSEGAAARRGDALMASGKDYTVRCTVLRTWMHKAATGATRSAQQRPRQALLTGLGHRRVGRRAQRFLSHQRNQCAICGLPVVAEALQCFSGQPSGEGDSCRAGGRGRRQRLAKSRHRGVAAGGRHAAVARFCGSRNDCSSRKCNSREFKQPLLHR